MEKLSDASETDEVFIEEIVKIPKYDRSNRGNKITRPLCGLVILKGKTKRKSLKCCALYGILSFVRFSQVIPEMHSGVQMYAHTDCFLK
ncbi:MAG: hypothetical protein JW973_11050 [Bacteroidales bacterium]|nr:hypothetical protein [Bacteroidales bacterium]